MPAKRVESFRQKEVSGLLSNKIVRLLHTKPFIDDKWLNGITRADLKKYLVVRYPSSCEKYLADIKSYKGKRVQWWDSTVHSEIKTKISGYDTNSWDRTKKDLEKSKEARVLFQDASFEYWHFDDFQSAQDKYISLTKTNKLIISRDSGDD